MDKHPSFGTPKSFKAEQFLVSTSLSTAACTGIFAAVGETTDLGKSCLE